MIANSSLRILNLSVHTNLKLPLLYAASNQDLRYSRKENYAKPACYDQFLKKAPKIYKPACYVIFDLNGTVLDTETLHDVSHTWYLNRFKKKYSWNLREKVMGAGDIAGARHIIKELELEMKPEQYVHGVWQKRRSLYASHKIPLLKGVNQLICHLSDCKVPLALVSSTGRKSYNIVSKPHKKLFQRFCHVVVGDDPQLRNPKPSPDIYQLAAMRFTTPPESPSAVLVIEDSPIGVRAAKAAGMQVVMVPDSRMSKESQHGADLVLECLFDLDLSDFKLPKL